MIDQKLINRINELAKIAKERELTVQEKEERDRLRKEYLSLFAILANTILPLIFIKNKLPLQT